MKDNRFRGLIGLTIRGASIGPPSSGKVTVGVVLGREPGDGGLCANAAFFCDGFDKSCQQTPL